MIIIILTILIIIVLIYLAYLKSTFRALSKTYVNNVCIVSFMYDKSATPKI